MDYFRPIIVAESRTVVVEAPYHAGFIQCANQLGGVFKDKKWHFSYRDEIQVRKACEQHFGYDGLTDPVRTDILIRFTRDVISQPNRSIDIMARPIARVSPRRRADPLIAPGTIIKEGRVDTDDDRVICRAGTLMILREVPLILFKNHVPNDDYHVETVDLDEHAVELLFYEHDQLVQRFDEIRELLDLGGENIEAFLAEANRRRVARIQMSGELSL